MLNMALPLNLRHWTRGEDVRWAMYRVQNVYKFFFARLFLLPFSQI